MGICFAVWLACGLLSLVVHSWALGLVPAATLAFFIVKGFGQAGDGRP
ncbi:hypothetical protein GCM10010468_07690 [Actinocorallia longicatena]|uniref:Uncharacterized protein n=2 Tax=Actinocorallia longicatena TaxID=111803 RepID=A0ABP6PYV8_9ACTN